MKRSQLPAKSRALPRTDSSIEELAAVVALLQLQIRHLERVAGGLTEQLSASLERTTPIQ
ncbi:MAG: hypothetical protein V3R57_06230 [Candidatus Bathyarchaeia archaeon]